ncbi:MAG TPA: helix-turn-helix domain-containing protein [Herbaspirillum sp.]|jgi:HTH-type transcriptional regulator/antitoxin HipB
MATYPIRLTAQLRQHLKAFRTARNLTQAQLGDIVGVSQARIAEIEANPGLVKFEQLMQLLSALEVTILLGEEASKGQALESDSAEDASQRPKKGIW